MMGSNGNVLQYVSLKLNSVTASFKYRRIPKISPRGYIFQMPFLRGLFLEGLIYGGPKLAFQNRLGKPTSSPGRFSLEVGPTTKAREKRPGNEAVG